MKGSIVERSLGLAALACVVAPVVAWSQTAPTPRRLTLEDAIELAIERHPRVVEASGAVEVERARGREAFGRWLPSVSFNSGASKSSSTRYNSTTGQTVTASSPFAYSAGLSTSLVLFDGLGRVHGGRAADANVEKASATLAFERFQVVVDAKRTFFDVVHASEKRRQAEAQVVRGIEQLELSRERLAGGAVIPSDTLRAMVELGKARLALLTAQSDQDRAEAALGRLTGLTPPLDVVIDPAFRTAEPIDTTGLRARALERAPRIAEAEAAWRATLAEVAVARAERLPRVSAGFSTTRSGTEVNALDPSWSLGFSVSWDLFDGFERRAAVASALAEERAASAKAEDARREVDVQVTEEISKLLTARARLEIALAARAAGEEDLRVQRERYRRGVGTIVEVLTAQQGLQASEVEIVDARRAYQMARAALEALVGEEL